MEKLTDCRKTICPCQEPCPLKSVLQVIGGKWKIQILCIIDLHELIRYGALKRLINQITPTMLAQSLHELETDGMIKRVQYNEIPVRVEYSMTTKGKSIIPLLADLKRWGQEYLI